MRSWGGVAAAGWDGARALGVDQPVEPADLALDLLEAVPLQLEGVLVHALAGAGEDARTFEPLVEPGAPALEDPQPGLGVGLREEGEPDVEVLVLPGGRPGAARSCWRCSLPSAVSW